MKKSELKAIAIKGEDSRLQFKQEIRNPILVPMIANKRDRLLEVLEKRMQQKTTSTPVFTIRWRVI